MWDDSAGSGIAAEGQLGKAYTEQAFRHFLDVERARAARASRPLRLLLVDLAGDAGKPERIPPALSGQLFEGLWRAVRETDFVGWYHDERVAGAVLAERAEAESGAAATAAAIQARVGEVLQQKLPTGAARRLRVKIVRIEPGLARNRRDA
jgi:hypothetical protein